MPVIIVITSLVDLLTTAQHSDKLSYSRLAIHLINCRLDSIILKHQKCPINALRCRMTETATKDILL